MAELWKNRTFKLVWASDLLQQLAIWIRNMALLLFVMEKTGGDPAAVALLSVLEYAPIFIFSIFGGLLADRWRPKRTMIAGDLLSGLSVGLIALLVSIGWWEALYGAVFVSAVLSQFSQPSSAKLFKRRVPDEHVPAAIGLTQSLSSLFLILGPVAGTAIYQWIGMTAVLAVLPALFLSSALVLSFLPRDEENPRERGEPTSLREDLRSGYRFLASDRGLRKLFVTFAIVGAASGLVQPLEIFVVTERLGLPKESLQWFAAADGVGLLLGGVLAAAVPRLTNAKRLLPAALLFLAVTFFVEAASVWPLLTGTFRFLNGILLAIVNTAVGSYVVSRIPEEMIGRVNGIVTPLFMGAMLIGTSLSGALTGQLGLLPVYAIAAVACAVSAIPAAAIPARPRSEETAKSASA